MKPQKSVPAASASISTLDAVIGYIALRLPRSSRSRYAKELLYRKSRVTSLYRKSYALIMLFGLTCRSRLSLQSPSTLSWSAYLITCEPFSLPALRAIASTASRYTSLLYASPLKAEKLALGSVTRRVAVTVFGRLRSRSKILIESPLTSFRLS